MKNKKFNKNKYKEEFGTEQNISTEDMPKNQVSSEEALYRKKEAYEGKFDIEY